MSTKGKILIADDDDGFRTATAAFLVKHGFLCAQAGDAGEATKALEACADFDALLADINMPGNECLQFVQSVSQICPGLPVVLMTGEPSFDTARLSLRLAVHEYLVKPPDLDEFIKTIESAVARRRQIQTIERSRNRLKEWTAELDALESALAMARRDDTRGPAEDFVRLSLRNMVRQLAELATAVSGPMSESGTGDSVEKMRLVAALQQTVAVLESTRQHFKSKELGELRRSLSTLLSESRGDSPKTF